MSLKESYSFVSLCANGKLSCDDIDDYVDEWHESDSKQELFEFLGMTQKEYMLWVQTPDILPFIITARVQNRVFDDVISSIQDLPMPARADPPGKTKALTERL